MPRLSARMVEDVLDEPVYHPSMFSPAGNCSPPYTWPSTAAMGNCQQLAGPMTAGPCWTPGHSDTLPSTPSRKSPGTALIPMEERPDGDSDPNPAQVQGDQE